MRCLLYSRLDQHKSVNPGYNLSLLHFNQIGSVVKALGPYFKKIMSRELNSEPSQINLCLMRMLALVKFN